MKSLFILTLIITFISGCYTSVKEGYSQHDIAVRVFSDSITQFNVKVFYEPAAVPFTGLLNITDDTWDITKESYEALFQNHVGRAIVTPTSTGDMTSIPTQNVSSWTSTQLISLGSSVAADLQSGTQINISVIFVKGIYNSNSSVLGVHFSGYPFVFVFKDVIASAGGTSNDQKYVEQAVVVHEIGHAVGLVNNGLPMATVHEDAVHQKHSSNVQCVMYWQVESASTILNSLTSLILAGSLNLFSADSLNDGRAYHP